MALPCPGEGGGVVEGHILQPPNIISLSKTDLDLTL